MYVLLVVPNPHFTLHITHAPNHHSRQFTLDPHTRAKSCGGGYPKLQSSQGPRGQSSQSLVTDNTTSMYTQYTLDYTFGGDITSHT